MTDNHCLQNVGVLITVFCRNWFIVNEWYTHVYVYLYNFGNYCFYTEWTGTDSFPELKMT